MIVGLCFPFLHRKSETKIMGNKKTKEELWTDFEFKTPKVGQKIRILRELEIDAVWDGISASKATPGQEVLCTEKTYWRPRD